MNAVNTSPLVGLISYVRDALRKEPQTLSTICLRLGDIQATIEQVESALDQLLADKMIKIDRGDSNHPRTWRLPDETETEPETPETNHLGWVIVDLTDEDDPLLFSESVQVWPEIFTSKDEAWRYVEDCRRPPYHTGENKTLAVLPLPNKKS